MYLKVNNRLKLSGKNFYLITILALIETKIENIILFQNYDKYNHF